MKLVSLRADGSAHRTWLDVRNTPQPCTYLIAPDRPVVESDGRQWSSPYPVIAFFYPGTFFQVFMLLKETHTDYYCNVILPPLFASHVIFIDLDLDVEIEHGQANVLDVSEFSARCTHYPVAWGIHAQQAVERLLALYERQQGPFHPATVRWWRGHVNV